MHMPRGYPCTGTATPLSPDPHPIWQLLLVLANVLLGVLPGTCGLIIPDERSVAAMMNITDPYAMAATVLLASLGFLRLDEVRAVFPSEHFVCLVH